MFDFHKRVWMSFAYIFLLISLLLQGCSSFADRSILSKLPIESIGAPKLIIDKNTYDFGVIKPNSTNTAFFNLTNVGDKTLIIEDVKKCCGTVIKLDKEELAPGESGVLTAEYHAGTKAEILNRSIGIVTNEPNSPQTILTIKGRVIQTIKLLPVSFKIASFSSDNDCPEIIIKSLDNTAFAIKGFKATNQCITVDFNPDFKATEFILKPEKDLSKMKNSSINRGAITIELDHPDYKTLNLNFDIIPSLQATPVTILGYIYKENESIRKSIKIRDNIDHSNANISEQIESIVSESGAKVEILKSIMVEKSCKLDLRITPSENKDSKSLSKDQLVIKMKDGRELNVPIRIFYATQTLSSKAN